MDDDMSLDPLDDNEIVKNEPESPISPKSLSEFDRLKMELEHELSMDLQAKEKEIWKETSKETSKFATETQKPFGSSAVESKKPTKTSSSNSEKIWLSTPPEERAQFKDEKHNKLIVTIKIFDRGLVVNGFSEDTSLYTLSRAWMKNQKTSLASTQYNIFALLAAASKRQNNGQDVLRQVQSGETKFICSMPATPPRETEHEISRVPTVEQLGFRPNPDKAVLDDVLNLEMDSDDQSHLTSKEDLLAQHKLRWKKTKSNWIKHIRNSDKHYEVNFSILENLYKSHLKN